MTSVWTILKMVTLPDVNGKIDFVWAVVWQCIVTNNGVSANTTGSITIDPESPSVNYTPYSDLTEDQVVGWVKDALGADTVAKVESTLNNETGSVILPLPWSA